MSGAPDPQFYRQDEEWALAKAIDAAKEEASAAVAREDFATAMSAMAKLRPHVRCVLRQGDGQRRRGADKAKLRENRLAPPQRDSRGHQGGRGFLED